MVMDNIRKVISKYYRLRFTDELREVVEALPVHGLQEDQVGNHVYSARGSLDVGGRIYHATVRVRLAEEGPMVYVSAPGAGVSVVCPFEASAVKKALEDAVDKARN